LFHGHVRVEKFVKMGPQILDFVVLPLASYFIDTNGPTVSFSRSFLPLFSRAHIVFYCSCVLFYLFGDGNTLL